MQIKWWSIALVFGFVLMGAAQQSAPVEFWGPKSLEGGKYVPPHQPHTKLAEVKSKHGGEKNWRELVVDDDHLHAEYILSTPGTKVSRRLHPDTREWWVVIDGEIRFDIEGQPPLVARKGSMVQVPMQTIYSMETLGDKPSLRLEVNIARARTLYPQDVTPPELPGFRWLPVTVMSRKPGVYDRGNVPLANLSELADRPEYKGKNFIHRFVNDDRALANVIYGWESKLPPLDATDRGHFHPDCGEFWLILAGQIRYPIENVGTLIAEVGDVVYVPISTFHFPRFHGPGPSCRLAMNGYTNIAHLFEAKPH